MFHKRIYMSKLPSLKNLNPNLIASKSLKKKQYQIESMVLKLGNKIP